MSSVEINNSAHVVEKEILRGIKIFALLNHMEVSTQQLQKVMYIIHEKRRMCIHKHTFILICEYMTIVEIVSLISTCKEYVSYEKYIWGFIQSQVQPISIIPPTPLNYKIIKQNIANDLYYFRIANMLGSEVYKNINSDEKQILKLLNIIKYYKQHSIGYRMHKYEIAATLKTRNTIIERETANVAAIFEDSRSFSEINPADNLPFYTIKPDMDMRYYGYNPDIEEEQKMGAIKIKWITGEYNTRAEYDYGSDDDNSEYDYYDVPGPYARYRIRKRPYYC